MQILLKILSLLKTLLGLEKQKLEIIQEIPANDDWIDEKIEPEPTNADAERLYKVAVSYLGKDASPKDLATDEFGCAETISNIIHEVFPDFPPEILSTSDLNNEFKKSLRFRQTLTPSEGAIIISPRTEKMYGHVGIFLSGSGIASNNSKTGLFDMNYNFETWARTFGAKGRGLKIYIYKVI